MIKVTFSLGTRLLVLIDQQEDTHLEKGAIKNQHAVGIDVQDFDKLSNSSSMLLKVSKDTDNWRKRSHFFQPSLYYDKWR